MNTALAQTIATTMGESAMRFKPEFLELYVIIMAVE